jgi:hypothetical protein
VHDFWACRKRWRKPQDWLVRPPFQTLLPSGRPKQTASRRFCSHTVQAPAQPNPLRNHSIASATRRAASPICQGATFAEASDR